MKTNIYAVQTDYKLIIPDFFMLLFLFILTFKMFNTMFWINFFQTEFMIITNNAKSWQTLNDDETFDE